MYRSCEYLYMLWFFFLVHMGQATPFTCNKFATLILMGCCHVKTPWHMAASYWVECTGHCIQAKNPSLNHVNIRPNKLKSPPSQGEELVKTCITEGKPTAVDKKTCICAPSTHAASFKCHLHRTNEAQKSSSSKDNKNKSDLLNKK